MTTFSTKRHIEFKESYQGINLTEFAFEVEKKMDSDQIVDSFIRTSHFSYDCLRDCVKSEPDKAYLRQAFDIGKTSIADFKKLNKIGTSEFLNNFLKDSSWGDDRSAFEKLLDKYLVIHESFGDNDFYVISKDWFGTDDEKVIEPERWCYTYYFLIVSVDRTQNSLTLSEWTYD